MLGAGFQGVCVALELARRGCLVDLYDAAERSITRAGLVNEGKIHLGFVYANDTSRRTADLMIEGALAFGDLIARWCGGDALKDALSSPFLYGVHRDTMVDAVEVERHFAHVAERVRGRRYLGSVLDTPFRRLSPRERAAAFGDGAVTDAFWTGERSVHVGRLAERLRAALEAEPRIAVLPGSRILAAEADGDGIALSIRTSGDGAQEGTGSVRRERYPQVVNCLWEDRRRIDRSIGRSIGLPPEAPCLYRFKIGVTLDLARPLPDLPSATLMLGPFGDSVSFGGTSLFLSWYPACMIGSSRELAPPDWEAALDDDTRERVAAATLDALGGLLPALCALDPRDIRRRRVAGGVIVAQGDTDIDDPDSGLHRRFEIGVRSQGGYHTVETGKYTTAPLFAMQAADRVTGGG